MDVLRFFMSPWCCAPGKMSKRKLLDEREKLLFSLRMDRQHMLEPEGSSSHTNYCRRRSHGCALFISAGNLTRNR